MRDLNEIQGWEFPLSFKKAQYPLAKESKLEIIPGMVESLFNNDEPGETSDKTSTGLDTTKDSEPA